jgi:hypothetical protein
MIEKLEYVVWVVQYKGKYYVNWNPKDQYRRARLINDEGKRSLEFPPHKDLVLIKSIPCYRHNGNIYFRTKIGVFSAVNGAKINDKTTIDLIPKEV